MRKTAILVGLIGTLVAFGPPVTAASHQEAPAIKMDFVVSGVLYGTYDVTGIGTETRIVEVESPDDSLLRKVPGRSRYSTLTLKRGLTSDLQMWDWRQAVVDGNTTPRDGSLTYRDGAGKQVRVDVKGMLLLSLTMGIDEHTAANGIAIETIEIAHEGFSIR
jgi:phage tail-like protein